MGTGLPALHRAPGPIQSPYGCLIEHTALLIELTALSLGPFPLPLRRGTIPHPHGTPVPSHRRQGGGWGGGWWLEKAKGQKGELLKLSRKRVPFCWQTEAGNVNWGQRKVSVFTGPESSSRAASVQDRASEKTGLLRTSTTSASSTTVLSTLHEHLSAYVVLLTFSQFSVTLCFIVVLLFSLIIRVRCVVLIQRNTLFYRPIISMEVSWKE